MEISVWRKNVFCNDEKVSIFRINGNLMKENINGKGAISKIENNVGTTL